MQRVQHSIVLLLNEMSLPFFPHRIFLYLTDWSIFWRIVYKTKIKAALAWLHIIYIKPTLPRAQTVNDISSLEGGSNGLAPCVVPVNRNHITPTCKLRDLKIETTTSPSLCIYTHPFIDQLICIALFEVHVKWNTKINIRVN